MLHFGKDNTQLYALLPHRMPVVEQARRITFSRSILPQVSASLSNTFALEVSFDVLWKKEQFHQAHLREDWRKVLVFRQAMRCRKVSLAV